MNAVLEQEGSRISHATWNGRSSPEEFASLVAKINAEGNNIRYTPFKIGTTFLSGTAIQGMSEHRQTWQVAYTIEGIRDWLFAQQK